MNDYPASTPSSHPQSASSAASTTTRARPPTSSLRTHGHSSWEQGSHRGLTPISTSSAATHITRPNSTINHSPARSVSSPTSAHFHHTAAANRQISSRHSSISSNSSPAGSAVHATGPFSSTSRSRAAAPSSNPVTSFPLGGVSAGGGLSRLARHSPSLSTTSVAGSPTSSIGSSTQLSSLVISQLNILLSAIKPDTVRAKWEVQAQKIRKLVDENGMELFTTYFRRLLQGNAAAIFSGATRASSDNGNYQLLLEEVQKIGKEPQQADKVAQSLDTSDGELFRDFDLARFMEHFRLTLFAKVALVLACRTVSQANLRTKGECH